MQCPRCGHEATGMARACVACGYMLPFSLRQLRQLRQAADTPDAPSSGDGVSPLAPSMLGAGSLLEAGNGAPSYAVPDGADAPRDASRPGTGSASPHRSAPTRPLSAPPTLRPHDDVERESTVVLPVTNSHPTQESLGATPSSGFGPASDGLSQPGSRLGGSSLPPTSGGLGPGGMGEPDPVTSTTSAMLALNAGTLLKSGRYRLVQRFSAATTFGRRGEPEPALYTASDTERPSARVLIQELPLADMRPDLAEQVFRRVIIRLQLAGERPEMPPLLDSFAEKGRRFVVFQLPEGERLSDRLRREVTLSEGEAIDLGLRLLDAVVAMASQSSPIVHANLSPDNVLLQRDGRVVLVGFSPTLLVQGNGQVEHGAAGGVRGFGAPEQQRGQADARSDLYAVAAILYQATTGQRPAQRSGALYESARKLNPNISAAFDAILAQALRPAAAQRTQTVDEMRSALAALQPAMHIIGEAHEHGGGRSAVTTDSTMMQALPGPAGVLRATMEHPVVRPKRRTPRPWLALAALLIVSLLGAGVIYAIHPSDRPVQTVTIPTEDATAVALFHAKGIGLSAGEFVFDTARPNSALKQQGAQAMAAHNPQAAMRAFQAAMAADKTDAEAALYAADAQIANSQSPSIAIVAAVAFGADSLEAESELQGVYLAQERINSLDLLPGTMRLRVLVANTGPTASDAAQVAQLIASAAAGNNAAHIVGVVGWPDTDQTQAASSALAAARIPLIAPTAPIPGLSIPVYFALGPSDAQQGRALADAAATVLHSQRVLVLRDPADGHSVALAQAFTAEAQQQRPAALSITRQEAFSTGHTTDFSQPVLDAARAGDDTILVAGNDADTANLARAVASAAQQAWVPVRVIAPSFANTPALLGAGAGPVAQLVRQQSAAMTAVYVGALASVGEWSVVGVPTGEQPSFYSDYAQQFGSNAAPDGLASPDATAILAYDAARLLGTAAARAPQGTLLPGPSSVLAALGAVRGSGAFQGVGGSISFAGAGGPAGKAMALLRLTRAPGAPASGPALETTVVAVLGGSGAFCGGATCLPG